MKILEGYQKGINFGGWLSQCSHEIEHYDTFIGEDDVKNVAGWGIDHVRLPVDYELVETESGQFKDDGFAYIESCILWCKRYNLNMILDLHKTAGYIFDDQEYSGSFFDNEALKNRFVRLWDELANRFSKYADFVAFELLNEIVDPNVADKWNELADRAIRTIRKHHSTITIILGGVRYNSVTSVKMLDMPYDTNIVYNFHCYEPIIFTHQAAYWVAGMPKDFQLELPVTVDKVKEYSKMLDQHTSYAVDQITAKEVNEDYFEELFKEAVKVAEERNVPLYCGEYGVIDKASPESTVRWYKAMHNTFEKYGIGRAAWTYKALDFGLIDEHYASIKDQLIELL